MMPKKPLVLALSINLLTPAAHASEKEELLKIKNTTLNLIQQLVQQGILDQSKADSIVKEAEVKAEKDAKQQIAEEEASGKRGAKGGRPDKSDKTVHVSYVPDFIKEEIRQEVRKELKNDVVKEVKASAREEKWGIPAALPDWVNRFKLTGDVRLRGEGDFFPQSNLDNANRFSDFPYSSVANWQAVNKGADITDPRASSAAYLNTSEDINRYRMRLRLGLDAQIADGLKAGVRLATSNSRSPVSTNQSLGQTGQQYEFVLDRGFLQYDYLDSKGTDWLTVWAGRTINPWLSTDNMFDSDLSFEGLSTTLRVPLPGGNPHYTPPAPNARYGTNMGFSQPNSIYMTGGIYPLEGEYQYTSTNKWLAAGQAGADLLIGDEHRFKFGVGYFDYENTKARPNTPDIGNASDLGDRNYTVPQFMQKGNTLMQINTSGIPGEVAPTKVGLASEFQVFNAIAAFDYKMWDENHLILTADYSENLGFNAADIRRRAAQTTTHGIVNYEYDLNGSKPLKKRTTAWQIRMDVGTPYIRRRSDWNIMLAYKYLERDSVLDAFTDSDFHLGGTNAKGWSFGASYGIATNTWLNARWLTADQIDGPDYGIDVLMVDLNSRF